MDKVPTKTTSVTRQFTSSSNLTKILMAVLVLSVVAGVGTGRVLSSKNTGTSTAIAPLGDKKPETAQQDTRTFKDFAEGTMRKRPESKNPEEYVEGTHFLERKGGVPVALTSSVVDLSEYEGKKVKVFGETQKALKEGWLMDVGRVEVQ